MDRCYLISSAFNALAAALLATVLGYHIVTSRRDLAELAASMRYGAMETERHTRALDEVAGIVRRRFGERAGDQTNDIVSAHQ